ncbi:MAG: DUF6526 family protein [Acidobacteriota bacterium]|nr:DUF6526 family protein [Acidobacteriota bacterium]
MAAEPQTFQNHRRFIPLYHFVLFAVFSVNAITALVRLVRTPSYDSALGFAVAAALLVLFFYVRSFPLTVQDRLIRAEMRARLQSILPADLRGRIDELNRDQFVALRFASDAEMADLVREVLTNKIVDRDDIKKRIKKWEPDTFRM